MMRQVPHYLFIGNGRVSRHFQHYFNLLAISFDVWYRPQPLTVLEFKISQASHILVLTSDAAIESFPLQYAHGIQAKWIHFSGALISSHLHGAHPLMSFADQRYPLETYQKIPFIVDHDAPPFSQLLPGLSNPYFSLSKELKPKYHALCVMSGNFSCILWQKLFSTFKKEFQLPESAAHPYLLQQMQNLLQDPMRALTGPLVRNDGVTIQENLLALTHDPFQKIYESFVTCYNTLRGEK